MLLTGVGMRRMWCSPFGYNSCAITFGVDKYELVPALSPAFGTALPLCLATVFTDLAFQRLLQDMQLLIQI